MRSEPIPGPSSGDSAPRLPRSVVARYAIGSLGTGGFATLPGLVLVYYMTDSLGIAAIVAGLIVVVAKVWDVLIDPVIGSLSDRSVARHGSRRGPMRIGALGLPFAFILTFAVVPSLAPGFAALWVLLAFSAAATFFSLFQVPYIALPAELTDGYRERTRLLTWRVVVLTLAILLFGAGGPEIRGVFPDNPTLGYLVMATVAGVVLLGALWIASSTAPRHAPVVASAPRAPTTAGTTPPDGHAASGTAPRVFTLGPYRDGLAALRDSQPFRALLGTFMLQGLATGMMLAGAQFVATWILGDERGVTILFIALIAPALLFAPLWRRVADRLGKERAFRLASLGYLVAAVSLAAMIWAPGWWIVAPVALAGASYAGMQSLPMAMLPDVISHDGGQRAGVFGGVWTAGETTGMALGSTILTLVLAATGYVASTAAVTVTQPPAAIIGIALAFSLLPAALMLGSLAMLGRYHLRERDLARAAGGSTSPGTSAGGGE